MSLRKVGRFFWLDIYVGGKRVRRSLKTGNKFEALDRYKKVKDKLLAEHRGGDVKFADFAKKYVDWAWSSKPASADLCCSNVIISGLGNVIISAFMH